MKALKITSKPLAIATLLIILAPFSIIHVNADELAIPVGHQGADKASLEKPKVGMTATAVETKFGAPLKKSTAVGKPPISSWEYPHYNVYFESDRVIHAVLKPYTEQVAAPVTETPVAPTAVPAENTTTEQAPLAETVAPVPAPLATETPAAEASQ